MQIHCTVHIIITDCDVLTVSLQDPWALRHNCANNSNVALIPRQQLIRRPLSSRCVHMRKNNLQPGPVNHKQAGTVHSVIHDPVHSPCHGPQTCDMKCVAVCKLVLLYQLYMKNKCAITEMCTCILLVVTLLNHTALVITYLTL